MTTTQQADPEILRYTAFAAAPGGGNPAGVVLDAGAMTDAEMLAVAQRVAYPETAFVVGRTPAGVHLRYFSPAAEVPFCGHATVATAVALAEREGVGSSVVTTASGDVPLVTTLDEDGAVQVAMTSVEPAVRPLAPELRAQLFALLGFVDADVADGFPVLESSAGNRHPVVVLADEDLFHQFRFDPARLADLKLVAGWAGRSPSCTGPARWSTRRATCSPSAASPRIPRRVRRPHRRVHTCGRSARCRQGTAS